jgi:hypothetical protein
MGSGLLGRDFLSAIFFFSKRRVESIVSSKDNNFEGKDSSANVTYKVMLDKTSNKRISKNKIFGAIVTGQCYASSICKKLR